MEYRLTKWNDLEHRLAKTIAAHKGVSLNKFIMDAIRAAILRAGTQDKSIRAILDRETGLK